ncbi:MAG: hypothetical protein PVH18_00460 [Chloroflexota bacterium]|jgi:hypothetical protein
MPLFGRGQKKEEPVCDVCRQPLKLTLVPQVRGARNQVEVILRNLPVLSCGTKGHPLRYAAPDFGVYLIDAIFWKKNIPMGRPGTLAKVKCYKCRKNLSKEPTRPGEVAGFLTVLSLPEFAMRIKGPVATCPRCGTEQLWASKEIGRDVSSALTVEAFKAAGL